MTHRVEVNLQYWYEQAIEKGIANRQLEADLNKLSYQLDRAVELLDDTSRAFFMDNYED